MLRRSSIRVSEQSVIAEQFLGKIEHTFINSKESVSLLIYLDQQNRGRTIQFAVCQRQA